MGALTEIIIIYCLVSSTIFYYGYRMGIRKGYQIGHRLGFIDGIQKGKMMEHDLHEPH